MTKKNRNWKGLNKMLGFITAFVLLGGVLLFAASVNVPNSFSPGQVISAGGMNSNFNALETAVNTTDTELTALENDVLSNDADISSLQSDVAGNASDIATVSNNLAPYRSAIFISNGSVGIGTESPSLPLYIHADNGNTWEQIARFEQSDGNSKINFYGDSFGDLTRIAGIQGSPNGLLLDGTGNTANSQLFLDVSGYVGIGTSSPTSLLHLYNGNLLIDSSSHSDVMKLVFKSQGCGKGYIYAGSPSSNDNGYLAFWTVFGSTSHERMRIEHDGDVCIGTTSGSYDLTVSGTAYCTSGAWSGSDIRWKENVSDIDSALDAILQLRGVSFDWNTTDYPDNGFSDARQIGFIAQEVEEVIPELVSTGEDGYKALAYDRMSAYLVEAIKELAAEKDALETEVSTVKAENVELSTTLETVTADLESVKAENEALEARLAEIEKALGLL